MIKYITDLHLLGLSFIDEPVMDCVESILEKDDILVIGGDIFNSYTVGLSNTTFYDRVMKLAEICKDIYLLTGNHDDNQGVCSFRLFNYAKDNVHIVQDYSKVTINNVNYHFLNHFRHYPKFGQLNLGGTNVLFSHAEINNEEEIPKSFLKFDRVYNGHIHDFGNFGHVVNTGAFRQTKKNESSLRHYLEIDGVSYTIKDVKTPVIVKEILFSDIKKLEDVPSVIKVIVKSKAEREKFNEIKDVYKNIHFKVEAHINSDISVSTAKQEVKKGLDVKALFNSYYKEFKAKFDYKANVDDTKLYNLFSKVCGEVKDIEVLDFRIDSLYLSNFKLFEELDLDFNARKDKTGITLVKGINNDEIVDGIISSNESGKTAIRQGIEYALIGSEAKVTPLRTGASSGESTLKFSVKGDSVKFERTFNSKSNDLRIGINNVEFGKDMTMTEKLSAFFDKYPIHNYLDFVLLYSRDWVGNFFNPKSNQKAKILAEMFPSFLAIPGNLTKDVQSSIKSLEDSYKVQLQAYETKQMERKIAAKNYKQSILNLKTVINNTLESISEYHGKIHNEPAVEQSAYTLETLNEYRKYLDIEPAISPFGHTTPIDIDFAFKKVSEHNQYLKKVDIMGKLGENIKYVESFLRGELRKDTSELSRQASLLNSKVIEERDRYERELQKLNKAGVCHTCGSVPSVEKQQEISSKIKEELIKIREYGLSLAKELAEKEKEIESINSFNSNFEKVYSNIAIYSKDDLQLVTKNLSADTEYDKHLWEKNNGASFNYWLSMEAGRKQLGIPENLNIDVEVAKIAAYSNRAFRISNYQSIVDKYTKEMESYSVQYYSLFHAIQDFNDSSRDALRANTKDIIAEELSVYKVLGEILYSKRTLNFESYFVSMFLEKVQAIITMFLSTLFTREITMEVSDCDLKFFDEGLLRTYNDFSKGARTKIEIALVLALGLIQREYGFSTNFMFIDEFLDEGVDETNIKRVVELLSKCYSGVEHIHLVSHKQIEEMVDHVLCVTRHNGKSTCLC